MREKLFDINDWQASEIRAQVDGETYTFEFKEHLFYEYEQESVRTYISKCLKYKLLLIRDIYGDISHKIVKTK